MLKSLEEIYLTILLGTALLFSLAIIFMIVVIRYQGRLREHLKKIENLKSTYLKAQLEVKEQTLKEISQEIHDNLGQNLSLVRLNLATLKCKQDIQKIDMSKELVQKVIEDLRSLSKSLNSTYTIKSSLLEEIKRVLIRIQKVTLCNTKLEIQGEERVLEAKKRLIIFRMVQEILNNTIKHAKAENIYVLMNYENDKLIILVKDDGIGFDSSNDKNIYGIGLQNLQDRSKLLNGKIWIESQLQKGTQVKLSIPLLS